MMVIGVAGAQIRLAKDFLAEKNDNPDYQEALEDMSSLLLGVLENNLYEFWDEDYEFWEEDYEFWEEDDE